MIARRVRDFAAEVLDRGAYWVDCVVSLVSRPLAMPHGVAVYFHGVLADGDPGPVDPQERIRPAFLRAFIRAMQRVGYTFVHPEMLTAPDPSAGNVALLTSDDGYASILRLLPVLEAESTPLAVFLTTFHLESATLYWWDQLYIAGQSRAETRDLLKHGVRSPSERDAALRALGLEPTATTYDDAHRLLSTEDVERLSHHPLLLFGNHTRHHLSLPLLAERVRMEEVEGARRDLEAWTGAPVRHFAFPYGDYDDRSVELLRRCGYLSAFTTAPGAFPLPQGATGELGLFPRYRLRGDRSVWWQVRIMRRGVTAGTRARARFAAWLRHQLHRSTDSSDA